MCYLEERPHDREPDDDRNDRARRAEADHPEAIGFEGVTKRFGSTVAVDDLTLSVRRGEFFSLLGPSGCGKTTTLRMIAGFEQPTEGNVYLEGDPVEEVPPYRRNVNTVFQSYALFEHLDVEGTSRSASSAASWTPTRFAPAWRRRSSSSSSPAEERAKLVSSRAGRCSASRSPVRSSTGPWCCCSTSHSARST